MRRCVPFVLGALLFGVCGQTAPAQPKKTADQSVPATVETSFKSANGQIRQFAFDGDPDTFFASADNVKSTDHFTLILDRPVKVKSISVTTGRPNGGDQLDSGVLEVSADGKKFERLVAFADGAAAGKPQGRLLRAIRIKSGKNLQQALAIREIVIDSAPAVTVFKNPVEFIVDVTDAPELKEWANQVARLCERQYPMICEELKSDGFKPFTVITMTLKKDYKGVAFASGPRITGSAIFFQQHPDDVGAMVHETAHCVQIYRTPNNPGWLVEGIADYVRFFKFEPGKLGNINPDRAHYDGSYRITAAFLDFVARKYDKQLINKLNKALREGEYKEEIWKQLTKKTVQELDKEWRASMGLK